jgi:hypothetical protein
MIDMIDMRRPILWLGATNDGAAAAPTQPGEQPSGDRPALLRV